MLFKVTILLIVFASFSFAFEAFQTDWSGGDGIYGPVYYWDDEFYEGLRVNWLAYPGFLTLDFNSDTPVHPID